MVAAENIDLFIKFLESHHAEKGVLTKALKDFLADTLTEKAYPKKHLLLHEDETPAYAWFILKGSARTYYYNYKNLRQVTTWFWHKGDFIHDRNLILQKPVKKNTELLEDSLLLSLSGKNIEKMIMQFPEYRKIERTVTEEYFRKLEDHYHMLQLDNNSRYQQLIQSHKEIFNLAYVRDIASFLNMHPKSLSRLRKY